jgi:hypothetical protein
MLDCDQWGTWLVSGRGGGFKSWTLRAAIGVADLTPKFLASQKVADAASLLLLRSDRGKRSNRIADTWQPHPLTISALQAQDGGRRIVRRRTFITFLRVPIPGYPLPIASKPDL